MDPFSSSGPADDTRDDFSSRSASFSSPFPPTPPQFSPTLPYRSLKYSLPPSGPKPRKITPPEEHPAQSSASNTENLRLSKQTDEKVISMVERWENSSHNWPEGPVRVCFSSGSFHSLMQKLNDYERDQKYPRYFYNSLRSEMIIQCMPSPIHENLPEQFVRAFFPAMSRLPPTDQSRIGWRHNEYTNGFTGRYTGSQKTPDLKVTVKNGEGNKEVKLIIEVGFSEKYNDLVADARLWLDGLQSVRMVILAKYDECPAYKNPIRDLSMEEIEGEQFADYSTIPLSAFIVQGDYGPVVYKGYTWAGQLSEAFVEVWKRDSTGLAAKSGNRVDLFSSNANGLSVKLSEFLNVDPANDATVSISAQHLIDVAKEDMQSLALGRFQKVMSDHARAQTGG